MESIKQNNLVIFILGTTGVGKSKLSLDLACKYGGEIVNADSMQVYQGNEGVMTAKPTPEEKSQAPHHVYDVVEMHKKDFNVNKYLDLAIPQIDEILSRGKLPIVVGGTNYYIEGLLFEKQKTEEEFKYDSEKFNEALNKARETLDQKYSELIEEFRKLIPVDNKAGIEEKYSGQESLLHDLLRTVDPKMGEYLHSKDRRRVINALFKYFKYLYQASDDKVVRESDIQMLQNGLKLRYYPVLIWIRAAQPILEQRVVKRIELMVSPQMNGLSEIFNVFSQSESHLQEGKALDFEKGILQAIGYKEFYGYYRHMVDKYSAISPSSIEPKDFLDQEKLTDAKLQLKNKTMQYTVSQIKWLSKRMNNLFLNTGHLMTIGLDDPKLYEEVAFQTSLLFIESHFQHFAKLSLESLDVLKKSLCQEYATNKALKMQNWEKYNCELCEQELNGKKQWEEHVQTRKHKNKVHKKYKQENPQAERQGKKTKKKEETKDEDVEPSSGLFDDDGNV